MAIQRMVEKKFPINSVRAVMDSMVVTGRIVRADPQGKTWKKGD
jgi:hypothetical protein